MMQKRMEYNTRRQDWERLKEEMEKESNAWAVHKEYG
jgi:hypothetical protein